MALIWFLMVIMAFFIEMRFNCGFLLNMRFIRGLMYLGVFIVLGGEW
jgi:hypothetical protein